MKFAFPSPAKSLVVIILLSVLLVAVSAKLYVTRNFILSFNAEATKDLTYQAYYAKKAPQSFTEQNSVKQQVKAGKSKVEIILPIHKIAKLRMDLGNNPEKLVISNLKLNGMKEIKFNDFNKFDYINIEKKEIFPDTLTIKANHKYPSIIYNEKLSAKGRIIIDWHIFIILSAFYFFVSWKLVKYLAKFKIEKIMPAMKHWLMSINGVGYNSIHELLVEKDESIIEYDFFTDYQKKEIEVNFKNYLNEIQKTRFAPQTEESKKFNRAVARIKTLNKFPHN